MEMLQGGRNNLNRMEVDLLDDRISVAPNDAKRVFKKYGSNGKAFFDSGRNDPVLNRILNISENARSKVNGYLKKNGLPEVGLPKYIDVKGIPDVQKNDLTDGRRNYVLPAGNDGAFYNTKEDGMGFYKAMVPGTEENKQLIKEYENGLKTAAFLASEYSQVRKPLVKLMRFYKTMIDSLKDPEKAEEIFAHEYGHRVAQCIKDGYGRTLNEQLMKAGLTLGSEKAAVATVEGFNTALTDDVIERKTTDSGTTYDHYNNGMKNTLGSMGMRPADVLKAGYRGGGEHVSGKYLQMAA